jgi:hypothetical protein
MIPSYKPELVTSDALKEAILATPAGVTILLNLRVLLV